MESTAGDQLVSFFIYSLFIYPVTNYIVSPNRKLPRWKAAFFAIIFLFSVSTLHMMYENMEDGPNHYQLLGVTRDSGINTIKKAYRNLSLEFHPDKNKSPTATEDFQNIKQAFDSLVDKDKRREYNRLGEAGVLTAAQMVVDHRYILLQLIVYYGSSVIFAFMMTFSEPSGEAFSLSLFGLTVMLLVEVLLVLQEVPLPVWFVPQHSPHDLVTTMHRLFPAFMNACKCVTGVFYVDKKAARVHALEQLLSVSRNLAVKVGALARSAEKMVRVRRNPISTQHGDSCTGSSSSSSGSGSSSSSGRRSGFMSRVLGEVALKVVATGDSQDGNASHMIERKVALISDPVLLQRQFERRDGRIFEMVRNLAIYLIARFLFVKGAAQ